MNNGDRISFLFWNIAGVVLLFLSVFISDIFIRFSFVIFGWICLASILLSEIVKSQPILWPIGDIELNVNKNENEETGKFTWLGDKYLNEIDKGW